MGESHVTVKAGTEVIHPPSMNIKDCLQHQKLSMEQIFPKCLQREHSPADTLISDFCLQNCGRINFCYFKPPNLWYLVVAALETYAIVYLYLNIWPQNIESLPFYSKAGTTEQDASLHNILMLLKAFVVSDISDSKCTVDSYTV